MAAEVVRLGPGDGNGSDALGAWLLQASSSPGLVAVVAAIPYNLLSLLGDKSGQGSQGIQGGDVARGLRGW